MKEQLDFWQLENYERISAFDGRNSDLSEIISGRYPNAVTPPEIGCVTSHLKVSNTGMKPVIVSMQSSWKMIATSFLCLTGLFSWKEVMRRIPYDWDCFQIAVINPRKLVANIHPRYVDDYSTAAFVVNRRYAEKLIHFHCRGDKFKLDNGVRPRAVADDLIYNAGKTYAMPLLLYKLELGSSIHEDHVEVFHKNSRLGLDHFWVNQIHRSSH